jgi:hypothetical protein
MRLRDWIERGRATRPPEVIPLLVVGLVASTVGFTAAGWIVGILGVVWFLVTDPGVVATWELWAAVGTLLLFAPVVVIGWWAVRLLVGSWVRAQTPDPPSLDR